MRFKGSCVSEVIAWALDVIEKSGKGPEMMLTMVKSEILHVGGNLGALSAYDDQPIPFIYVHTLYLLAFIYMPLVAYALANNLFEDPSDSWLVEVIGTLFLFIFLMFTDGLISIGK